MPDLLPCPLCGGKAGYHLTTGETYRWWVAVCSDCGDPVCECRSDDSTRYNAELPARWGLADIEWNEAAEHAHELRTRLDAANAEIERLRAELGALTSALHYPGCWDTAAYPTIESALHEVAACFRCTECNQPPSVPVSLAEHIVDSLQDEFDTEGITEAGSGDALIRLTHAIEAVRDAFATTPKPEDGHV